VISNEPARRPSRAHRDDGERSRNAILDAAARLATTEGIGGLSLSRLADAVGMSKSGLFAHFGSKEELQLATIEKADSVFSARVVEPAMAADRGLGQLRTLVHGFLAYLEADTFPGGCFFASVLAEVDTQPGAVRDRLVRFLDEWLGRLETAVRDAQADGAIDPAEDPAQITFEIEAALLLANAQYIVSRTPEPIERARRAVDRCLTAAGAPPAARDASPPASG